MAHKHRFAALGVVLAMSSSLLLITDSHAKKPPPRDNVAPPTWQSGAPRGCTPWADNLGGYSRGHVKCAGQRISIKVRVQCAGGAIHESSAYRWEYNKAECKVGKEGGVDSYWTSVRQ